MTVARVDVAVIGAGPAGLAAAAEVARSGGRVVVLDENPVPGGRLPSQVHLDPEHLRRLRRKWVIGKHRATALVTEAKAAGARIRCGMSVWHLFRSGADWHVCICPAAPGKATPADGFAYDAKALVVATGAVQQPMVFDGWTIPGVFTAGAVQTMVNVSGVLPGRRVLVVGIDPLGMSAAQLLSACGVQVAGVVLPPDNGFSGGVTRPDEALPALIRMTQRADGRIAGFAASNHASLRRRLMRLFPERGVSILGVPLILRSALNAVRGPDRVTGAETIALSADGNAVSGTHRHWSVDAVVTACGLSPLTELPQVAGCPLVNVPELGGWVPVHGPDLDTPLPGLFLAGGVTGIEGAAVAENQGRIAGIHAARYLELIHPRSAETEIRRRHDRIKAIRSATPGFLPDIPAGRAAMTEHWRARGH